MSVIIDRINELRAQKQTLLTNAQTETDPKKLVEIRDQIKDLNDQIHVQEDLRDEMAGNARLVPPTDGPKAEQNLGDILQQVAAREFNSRGNRIRGVEIRNVASGQSEEVDEDGGLLLTPTITRDLLKHARENSFFLPKAQSLPVGPDSTGVKMPYVQDKDRTDGKRFGGVRAYWMGEAEKYTASVMKFGTRGFDLAKLGAIGYATEEILRDSQFLESIMRNAFMNEMAFQIDEGILFGLGTREGENTQPVGMLNNTAVSGNAALMTVAKETNQAAATVNIQNILNIWNRVAPENRVRAMWLINPDLELQLMQMLMQVGTLTAGETAATQGLPIFMPANGLSGSPYSTLLSRPIVPNEHMNAVGALGDIALIDPTEYFWIDRDGIKAATSVHVRFEYDEMAFKFTYRCNGMPSWYGPTTPPKGGTTRSPYAVLAARA